jgi:hypothetical protein
MFGIDGQRLGLSSEAFQLPDEQVRGHAFTSPSVGIVAAPGQNELPRVLSWFNHFLGALYLQATDRTSVLSLRVSLS